MKTPLSWRNRPESTPGSQPAGGKNRTHLHSLSHLGAAIRFFPAFCESSIFRSFDLPGVGADSPPFLLTKKQPVASTLSRLSISHQLRPPSWQRFTLVRQVQRPLRSLFAPGTPRKNRAFSDFSRVGPRRSQTRRLARTTSERDQCSRGRAGTGEKKE